MQATILCYHKVGQVAEEGRRLNIEPSRLRSHVRFFFRKKSTFLRVCDLVGPWTDGIVCFTFDDAYQSTMVHAPSIFEEVGARATFYAVPGRVGGVSDWDGDLARPLAGWDLLRETQSKGHEIGNHSQNHLHLADLTPEEQCREITEAHKELIGRDLRPGSFCFPYGSNNDETIKQLKKANYGVAVALGKRPALDSDERLRLSRVVVAYSDTVPMLLYKLILKPKFRK